MDRTKRRDRNVLYEEADEDEATTKVKSRVESVARIPVPFQKNVVSKAVSFLFGNPVKIVIPLILGAEKHSLNSVRRLERHTFGSFAVPRHFEHVRRFK